MGRVRLLGVLQDFGRTVACTGSLQRAGPPEAAMRNARVFRDGRPVPVPPVSGLSPTSTPAACRGVPQEMVAFLRECWYDEGLYG